MKHTLRFLLLLFAVFTGAGTQAQTATLYDHIRRAFAALREKDEKAYIILYPNGAQMKTIIQAITMQRFQSEDMKKFMAAQNLNADSLMKAQFNQMSDT